MATTTKSPRKLARHADRGGPWMRMKDAMEVLGMTRITVNGLVKRGLLRERPVPGVRARFIRSEVEALAARQNAMLDNSRCVDAK
jgi:predicted DNA-binding transcriptional regulator AlpA